VYYNCEYLCLLIAVLMFFCFMRLRTPRSTLFPTRRSSDLRGAPRAHGGSRGGLCPPRGARCGAQSAHRGESGTGGRLAPGGRARSEEHTSELQSRENLVCRLLLEKKKILDLGLIDIDDGCC